MTEPSQPPAPPPSEGADSFRRGLPRSDCPYPPGATERDAWLAAWDQAADADAADQSAQTPRSQ